MVYLDMHFSEAKGILSARGGMNIYRGCTHGCIYCDSRSRCYQINHDFEDIEVKRNAPELLEQKISFRFSPLVVLFLKTGVCGALRFFKFDFGNSVRDGRSKLHPLGKWILQGQKSVLFIIYSQNYLTRYLLKCVFLKQGRCSVDF